MISGTEQKPLVLRFTRIRSRLKRAAVIGLISAAIVAELVAEDLARFIVVPALVGAMMIEAGLKE